MIRLDSRLAKLEEKHKAPSLPVCVWVENDAPEIEQYEKAGHQVFFIRWAKASELDETERSYKRAQSPWPEME